MNTPVSYSVLSIIQCNLNRYKEKHLLQKPVTLPCNHSACLECVNEIVSIATTDIECAYPECRKKHEVNGLNDLKINNEIDIIIRGNVRDLFTILKTGFTQIYANFNEIDFALNIDKNCEFIENDIDLKIESLKLKLDKLSDTYHEKLKMKKEIAIDNLKEDEYIAKKNEFFKLTQQEHEDTLEQLYEYERKVLDSKSEIDKLILNTPKVEFTKSELNIDEKFIGKFEDFKNYKHTRLAHTSNLQIPHTFLNRIAYFEAKEQYLITDREDKTIKILSKTGNYLGEYNPNLIFEYPFAIYVNNLKNEIFVGDYKLQCIFVFDENFNKITEFGHDVAKAPNTITMDKITGLVYCTDYWYDKVSIWYGEQPSSDYGDNCKTTGNFHCTKYTLSNEFTCDSPAYIQIADSKIFIVSAVELEIEENTSKLKDIKKDWIEPYGLVVDSQSNIYTSASNLDNDNNISTTAYLFKFDKNGCLLNKMQFSNWLPIDFYIHENRVLSISTDTFPLQLDVLKDGD